jgi:hypothetical protein
VTSGSYAANPNILSRTERKEKSDTNRKKKKKRNERRKYIT